MFLIIFGNRSENLGLKHANFLLLIKALDLISKRQIFQHTPTSGLGTNCREKTKKKTPFA